MDDFQFIMETPQNAEGHKKRPRLVTSCDNCRLKKIKCLQSGTAPESQCEACKVAKIPCRFRDREKYFAERSRAIAGTGTSDMASERSSSRGSSRSDHASRHSSQRSFDATSRPSSSYEPYLPSSSNRSTSHSPRSTGLIRANSTSSSHYSSYSRDSHSYRGSASPYSYSPPRVDSPAYTVTGTTPLLRKLSESNSQNALFNPDRPEFPHPRLMPHFIQMFFEQMGGQCPFLSIDEVTAQFFDQTLSALLANCIASLAARYSDSPELISRGTYAVAETFSNNAKNILTSVVHIPTVDNLHALLLISWCEYKSNRISGFRAYIQMAMRMAVDLGLSEDATIQVNPSEHIRNMLRVTWTSVVQLHFFASSCKPEDLWSGDAHSNISLTPPVHSVFSLVST